MRKEEVERALFRSEALLVKLKRDRKGKADPLAARAITKAILDLADQCRGYRKTLRVLSGIRERDGQPMKDVSDDRSLSPPMARRLGTHQARRTNR